MRAKEANNLKFQFLNPDNAYHHIYKQVERTKIKSLIFRASHEISLQVLETKRSRPKNYVANLALAQQASLDVEQSLKMVTASMPSAAPNLTG